MSLSDLNQQSHGTVSTSLRLAFEDEHGTSITSTTKRDGASMFSCLSDELKMRLRQQRDEMDQFLRVQVCCIICHSAYPKIGQFLRIFIVNLYNTKLIRNDRHCRLVIIQRCAD